MKLPFDSYIRSNFEVLGLLDTSALEELRVHLAEMADSGATLWVAGNGGSETTASHFVADMVKSALQFGNKSVRTIALTEQSALNTALVNDVSFEESLAEQLALQARRGDTFLYLSVSGLSPNLVTAAKKAEQLGISTIGIVGERGEPVARQLCKVAIIVPSDDYQIVENAHVFIMHWLCKVLEG